ncbi:hypothetical protein MMC30_004696 [Trapelia coarctata]|nr:hypothetical protein [Trapelia coarctata]
MKVISVLALALLSALPTHAYYGNNLQARDVYLEARDAYLEAREAYMDELDGLHARDSYFETRDRVQTSQIKQPCARCLAECNINSKKPKEELRPYNVVPYRKSCRLACENIDKCENPDKPRE